MFPIYEQGKGKGIGYNSQSFSERFDAICHEHLRQKRARAFAFIFYDFGDQKFRQVLKNQGVFAELDRLSGSDLSVFYLHSARRQTVDRFNAEFLKRLGVADDVRRPCVVFFRVKDKNIEDVAVAQLDSADLIHGFRELYGVIERYIKENLHKPPGEAMKNLRWFKGGTMFMSIEAFRALLKSALEKLL